MRQWFNRQNCGSACQQAGLSTPTTHVIQRRPEWLLSDCYFCQFRAPASLDSISFQTDCKHLQLGLNACEGGFMIKRRIGFAMSLLAVCLLSLGSAFAGDKIKGKGVITLRSGNTLTLE